jgi:insertion element IS1 protein InsB
MGKSVTHEIERSNCRNRHQFGRFKRKSIVVSKPEEMVDLTMAFFARYRLNGDLSEIFAFDVIILAIPSEKADKHLQPVGLVLKGER